MNDINDVIELNIATRWDDEAIIRWAAGGNASRRISSVFGSRQQQLTGHGRAPADVQWVADAEIARHAHVAHAHGLKFLYLLNGRCEHMDFNDVDLRLQVLTDVEWIIEDVRADCIVVADLRLGELIRSAFSSRKVALRVSTVTGVKTMDQLRPWLPLDIDGVVLHHDAGRDFEHLRCFVSSLGREAPGVEIELLLNESCLYGCPSREAHYARLARERLDYTEGFQQSCNLPKFRDPSLLLRACWIRPEDLDLYKELGIRRFKVAGREMPSAWLERAAGAYLQGQYQGNLVDLLTMTPPGLDVTAADIFFVENAALDGFLQRLRNWQGKERDFYRLLSSELWSRHEFTIKDPGSHYNSVVGGVRCSQPGDNFIRLSDLRVNRDPFFRQRMRPTT